MCNYKLTVTIGKNSDIVVGGGWVRAGFSCLMVPRLGKVAF